MRMMLTALVFTTALMAIACDPAPPTRGEVVADESLRVMVGDNAPTIPLRTEEGKTTTLEQAASPIMVVGFIPTASQADCNYIHPDLLKISGELQLQPVSVIQISEPTDKCPRGLGAVSQGVNLRKQKVMALSDGDRIAWSAFRDPQPGTVFIIDSEGKITARKSLDDIPGIVDIARDLGESYQKKMEDIESGT